MTGKGHSWTGFAVAAAVYKFTSDSGMAASVAVPAFLIGVTAPDWLEIRKKGGGTVIKHRTITHWLPIWVAMFFISFYLYDVCDKIGADCNFGFGGVNISYYLQGFFIGFSLGGLLHLLTDIPNPMGIPILTPSNRFSLKLWKSGKNEVAITLVLFLISMSYVGVLNFDFNVLNSYFY